MSRTPMWLDTDGAIDTIAEASSVQWSHAERAVDNQMGWIRKVLRAQDITSAAPLTDLKVLTLEHVLGVPQDPDGDLTPDNYPYIVVDSSWGTHHFKIGWRLTDGL